MKIVSIGGGPAGLYFAILMKRADPSHQITVIERNGPDDTFGFGVVFSDATLGNLGEADPESYAEIRKEFAHWDDIDTYFGGERHRSTGHGFCGLSRQTLLHILQRRCRELGVELRFEEEVTDVAALAADADLVLGADGVASRVRDTYADTFQPTIDTRPNRFVWLGTTVPFEAFTFYFKQNQHGLWRVHAYRYQETGSTFIVECTDETWRASGMDRADEDQTIAYLQDVFANELDGHPLIKNRSIWRNFPTISNARWHHDNVVLVGDAVHTAHFSIGSGTKLAMEDCIYLADALRRESDLEAALTLYENERRPGVEKLQRAAQVSLEWFENTERYTKLEPIQFTFSLLTRSLRVTHANLALRDPEFVAGFDRWFAGQDDATGEAPLPRQTPLTLRNLTLRNRLVAAPTDGSAGDARARAAGGAALVMTRSADPAVASAAHDGGAAAGLVIGIPHPGYRVPEPPTDQEAAVATALVDAVRAAGDAGFDLVEVDLSTGLGLELAAEPRERETLLGLVRAARAAWPEDRPLAVRLAAVDWEDPDGFLSPRTAVRLAADLRDVGADLATVISIGAAAESRLMNVQLADRVRLETGMSVVTEGGVWSFEDIDSVVAAGRVDLCAFVGDQQFRPRRDAE